MMKSYRIHKEETELKLKIKKKENAQDTKNKFSCLKVGQTQLLTFKFFIMKTLRNKVQLIGNVGNTPEILNLESGKKLSRFSMATNETYTNSKGEKVQETQWHTVIAWGKTAEIVEKFVGKGKEIAIEGKLTSRSYENESGEKKFITEIAVNEILLLG